MTIYEEIRNSRIVAGLHQTLVAKAVGMTQSTYSRFECGQGRIHADAIPLIKEFISCHPVKYTYPRLFIPHSPKSSRLDVGNLLAGMGC